MTVLIAWLITTTVMLGMATLVSKNWHSLRTGIGIYVMCILIALVQHYYLVALLDLVAMALLFGVYRLRREVRA